MIIYNKYDFKLLKIRNSNFIENDINMYATRVLPTTSPKELIVETYSNIQII
jgi:hypothetical protein